MLITPVDRIRCSLVGELRVPARVSSLSVLPSPLSGRVGVHILTFEACSSFTRVTACRVAHPPYVGFIARLRPGQFPGSGARKLPSSTNNLLGWVLPPLVICAVEAHPITPCLADLRQKRSRDKVMLEDFIALANSFGYAVETSSFKVGVELMEGTDRTCHTQTEDIIESRISSFVTRYVFCKDKRGRVRELREAF